MERIEEERGREKGEGREERRGERGEGRGERETREGRGKRGGGKRDL